MFKKFKTVSFANRTRLQKRTTLVIAIIAFVLLFWVSNSLYQYLSKSSKSIETPALIVETIRVKQAPMSSVIETIGSLTAKKELKIKAAGNGRMQELLVESGSWVKAGTLLANVIAAPEVRAPFDGFLTDWLVKPGEYIIAGTELVDLVNTDLLSLTYRVPEQYADKLEIGQIVEVTVKAFPEKIFTGEVRFISPIVDKKTYTILIKAEVKNPDQNLWPGMSAHVRQILTNNPNALIIPESCLILSMEGYQALVISEGKILKKTIKIGDRHGGRVHVVSGLTLGEPVILARTGLTVEGAKAVAEDWTGEW